MEQIIKKFYLIAFLFIAQTAYAQLSPDEKKVIEYVNAHFKESEELLIELVNINSGTLNTEGVKKVGAVYRREFDKLDFLTE